MGPVEVSGCEFVGDRAESYVEEYECEDCEALDARWDGAVEVGLGAAGAECCGDDEVLLEPGVDFGVASILVDQSAGSV